MMMPTDNIHNMEWLQPKPNYPTYPPYHKGLYLEDYFIEFYKHEIHKYKTGVVNRKFIPVSWTSYYNNGCNRTKLQNYLEKLNPEDKFFTVCQHDDAPSEKLPPDTLVFSAGGNSNIGNIIPIPLICSSIIGNEKIQAKEKDIFCSFVGSNTHRIRKKLQIYSNDPKYFFKMDQWKNTIEQSIMQLFIDVTSRSKFTLCPRGYGKTSFRLYESMQLGSVPVYVSDEHYLPWQRYIDWEDICILIKEEEISKMDIILQNVSDDRYEYMLSKISRLYEENFSLDGACRRIIERVTTYDN